MSESALYRDPVFEKVAAIEIREKGCAVCTRSVEVFDGAHQCTVHKTFPKCRGKKNGFQLDEGE